MNATRFTHAQYPHTPAAQLDIAQREAEGVARLVGWEEGDDTDEAFEARLNECRANDAAARAGR